MRPRSQEGFTLIEILIVVFIIGLLAAIVAPKFIGSTDDAKITAAKTQIANFETALKLYKIDNGSFPTTEQGLEALVARPTANPVPPKYRDGGYLEKREIPKDPWGNPYLYVSPGQHGDYDIVSFGADGREGGTKNNADITSWSLN